MKKSVVFLLASLATGSSLLFHTQEAKAGKVLDECPPIILKKNNAGNFVVKNKFAGYVLFSGNNRTAAEAVFNQVCNQ